MYVGRMDIEIHAAADPRLFQKGWLYMVILLQVCKAYRCRGFQGLAPTTPLQKI